MEDPMVSPSRLTILCVRVRLQAVLGSKSRCGTVSVREYAACVIRIPVTALSLSVPSEDQ
jgi:hypothetical protein